MRQKLGMEDFFFFFLKNHLPSCPVLREPLNQFLNLGSIDISLVWGCPVIFGCLAVFLISTHQMPGARPSYDH